MKRNLGWLVLLLCLLGPVLVGLLMPNPDPGPKTEAANSGSKPVEVADAAIKSPPGEFWAERAKASADRQSADRRQANAEAVALADPESPANSEELDKNRDWARRFPAEALAWLRMAPEGAQRDTVAEIVCPQLALTDPSQAVEVAEHCGASGTNLMENVLDNLAQLWAERDEQAAFAWAVAKPPGNDRDRLFERIVFVESKTDPANAARMVVEQISPGETQEEAAMSVVYQWARQDADSALAWAQHFPAGGLRDRAIQEVENVKAFSLAGQAAF